MDRGLVIKLKNYPIDQQRADLEAAHVEVIYTDMDDAISSLRKGDRLAIATPLHMLATARDRIELAVERIQKMGCEIIDVTSGYITTGTGVQMMGQALRAISSENRFGDLKKASAAGLDKRWSGAQAKRKETYDEAYDIWWDLKLSGQVALERCAALGWSKYSVYGDVKNRRKGLMNKQWEHPQRKAGRPPAPWK